MFVFSKIFHEIEKCSSLKFLHKFQILFANLNNVRELEKMLLFSNMVLKFENVQFSKKTKIQIFGGWGFYKIFDFPKKSYFQKLFTNSKMVMCLNFMHVLGNFHKMFVFFKKKSKFVLKLKNSCFHIFFTN